MPAPYSRVHPKIHVEDLAPDAPGHLLSLKEHKYVRTLQLRHSFANQHKSLTNIFLTPTEHATLSHPVFIGEKGEAIAIYQKQQLGKGAFGTVYLGINLDTGEIHAIKYQKPKRSERAQVVVEDQILDDLGTLIDRTVTTALGGRTFVSAQKLAWGENMRSFVTGQKAAGVASASTSVSTISDMDSIDMAIQLLEQINNTHQKGYVHRDIKLENAMWDKETKTAALIDFGISKKMTRGKYIGEEIEGTPHIIAPELYRAHTNAIMDDSGSPASLVYSAETDMYAAGIALVELTSVLSPNLGIDQRGYYLHAGAMSELEHGIAQKLLDSAPDILVEESPDPLKNAFNHCIRRMLEADPNARITFPEALAELRSIKAKMEERAKASIEDVMSGKSQSDPEESDVFDIKDLDMLAIIDGLKSFAPDTQSSDDLQLSQIILEEQISELSEYMDKNPSLFNFEAVSEPSVAAASSVPDVMQISISDPEYKALYEIINDFIEANNDEPSMSRSSRKSLLISDVSGADKVEFLNDLKEMQKIIAQSDQTMDISQNTLLLMRLSDLIIDMRGKNYAASLKSVHDTQKSSQFGFAKSLEHLLHHTGETIKQKLESTPEFENGNKAKGKKKARHKRPYSPEEGQAHRKGRGHKKSP